MLRLSKDAGSSWSQFAWSNISPIILEDLWAGICSISENVLQKLPPFYANIFWSFAYVNNLFYEQMDTSQLQQNLWFGCVYNSIDWDYYQAGYFMIGQLPNIDGMIDLSELTPQLKKTCCSGSPYLKVCAFQQTLGHFLVNGILGTFVFHDQLLLCCKCLLQQATTTPLSLNNWCVRLNILPLEVPEAEKVFRDMLLFCKITKFREINFKILSQILVMPKVISKVKHVENLAFCVWCGEVAMIEYILLWCSETNHLHDHIKSVVKCLFSDTDWIFGHCKSTINPVIWIINFSIYKSHILACEGHKPQIFEQAYEELVRYQSLFPFKSHLAACKE